MSTSIGPSVLDTPLLISELRVKRKDAVLQELVRCAHAAGAVREHSLLLETLTLREKLGTTAVGKGVALPNARSIAVIESRLVVARSSRGVDWKAVDEAPVQIVLLVLSPSECSVEAHHEFLARAAAFGRLQRNRQRLLDAETAEEAIALLREVTP